MAKLQVIRKMPPSVEAYMVIFKVTLDDNESDDYVINEDLVLISVASEADIATLGTTPPPVDAPSPLFRCDTVTVLVNSEAEMERVIERVTSDVLSIFEQQKIVVVSPEEETLEDHWFNAQEGVLHPSVGEEEEVVVPELDPNIFVVKGVCDNVSSSSSGAPPVTLFNTVNLAGGGTPNFLFGDIFDFQPTSPFAFMGWVEIPDGTGTTNADLYFERFYEDTMLFPSTKRGWELIFDSRDETHMTITFRLMRTYTEGGFGFPPPPPSGDFIELRSPYIAKGGKIFFQLLYDGSGDATGLSLIINGVEVSSELQEDGELTFGSIDYTDSEPELRTSYSGAEEMLLSDWMAYQVEVTVPEALSFFDAQNCYGGAPPITPNSRWQFSAEEGPERAIDIVRTIDGVLETPTDLVEADYSTRAWCPPDLADFYVSGKSLSFDGVDELMFIGPELAIGTDFGIGMWIKIPSYPLFASVLASSGEFFVDDTIAPASWIFWINSSGNLVFGGQDYFGTVVTSVATVPLNTWTYVRASASSFDGIGVAVNDAQTFNFALLPATVLFDVTIAANNRRFDTGGNFYFDHFEGLMDDPFITDFAILSSFGLPPTPPRPRDLLVEFTTPPQIYYHNGDDPLDDATTVGGIQDQTGNINATCINMEASDIVDDAP